jgi:prepilin-type N-terminal cleavage/methylation domain-containing protein
MKAIRPFRITGFSLIESLLVLAIFGIALTLAGKLLVSYLKVGRQVDQRAQWQSIRLAVQRMCDEAYEAQRVDLTGSVLNLAKIDPRSHPARRDLSYSPTDRFDPYDESFELTIQYALEGNEVRRSIITPNGTLVTPVASPIESLSMSLDDGLLSVDVGFSSDSKTEKARFLVEVLR